MCAAITSASLGLATAGYSIYQGAEQKKKAKAELNGYERQESNMFLKMMVFQQLLLLEEKNHLLADSHDVAQRITMMYTFFANCKTHLVNPYLWLKYVLKNIQGSSTKVGEVIKKGIFLGSLFQHV